MKVTGGHTRRPTQMTSPLVEKVLTKDELLGCKPSKY